MVQVKSQWEYKIFEQSAGDFEALALEIFRFQYGANPLYRDYADAIRRAPGQVHKMEEIPFLPIRFFKTHKIKTTSFETEMVFESSGTTGTINSRHYVKSVALYEESFIRAFQQFYGSVTDWCVIGLLPSYLERNNSSLVYMTEKLIEKSGHRSSGFYLHDKAGLAKQLQQLQADKQQVFLIGATFGLLDFAAEYPMHFRNTVLVETGGMKGRREEMVRAAVHDALKRAFDLPVIHSEYGMTELLSQAWSAGEGIFECPSWMKVLVRDEDDPLSVTKTGKGAINCIDLANLYSCSFIATDDAGEIGPDGRFGVLGRLDGSDLRGCSLLTV